MTEPQPLLSIVPDRRTRFQANPFETLIALLAVISAVVFLLPPDPAIDGSTVEQAVPLWVALVWNVLYGLSGVGILAGLWTGKANVEVAGLILLVSGVLVSTVAALDVRGESALAGVFTFLAVALSCAVRIRILTQHRRAVIVSVG